MAKQKPVTAETLVEELPEAVLEEIVEVGSFKTIEVKKQLEESSSALQKEIPVLEDQISSIEFKSMSQEEQNSMQSQLHFMKFLLQSIKERLSFF